MNAFFGARGIELFDGVGDSGLSSPLPFVTSRNTFPVGSSSSATPQQRSGSGKAFLGNKKARLFLERSEQRLCQSCRRLRPDLRRFQSKNGSANSLGKCKLKLRYGSCSSRFSVGATTVMHVETLHRANLRLVLARLVHSTYLVYGINDQQIAAKARQKTCRHLGVAASLE